jgi:tryptophan synthase alpha subunit
VIDNGANAAVVGSRFAEIVEQNLDDSDKMLKMLRKCAQKLKGSTMLSGSVEMTD